MIVSSDAIALTSSQRRVAIRLTEHFMVDLRLLALGLIIPAAASSSALPAVAHRIGNEIDS